MEKPSYNFMKCTILKTPIAFRRARPHPLSPKSPKASKKKRKKHAEQVEKAERQTVPDLAQYSEPPNTYFRSKLIIFR